MKQRIRKADREALDALLRPYLAEPAVIKIASDGEVTGDTPDGVRVSLGNYTHAPVSLLNYLSTHRTPDTW